MKAYRSSTSWLARTWDERLGLFLLWQPVDEQDCRSPWLPQASIRGASAETAPGVRTPPVYAAGNVDALQPDYHRLTLDALEEYWS